MQHNMDEMAHYVRQMAASQVGKIRLLVYGHINDYDPVTHSVKVGLQAFRDDTSLVGQPFITQWIQLGTPFASNNAGFQYAPIHGQAQAGDQCVVAFLDNEQSVSAVAFLTYNDNTTTPSSTLQPGEFILQHKAGGFLYFKHDGTIEIFHKSGGILEWDAAGDLSVTTATGNINLDPTGGQAYLGQPNLTTGAQTGFPCMSVLTSSGPPSNPPSPLTGGLTAYVYDPTLDKLWIWNPNTSQWKAH